MRNLASLDTEIRKLRIIVNDKNFEEKVRDNAWAMMLTLQWVKTKPKDCTLGPTELTGISMDIANAIKKREKRLKK
jgi:hypothetical protein